MGKDEPGAGRCRDVCLVGLYFPKRIKSTARAVLFIDIQCYRLFFIGRKLNIG